MGRVDIRLDHAGFRELLTGGDVRDAVVDLAESTRNTVAGSLPAGTDVVVDSYTTDRAAASVTIRDVRGKLWQARDGVFTRAAAAHGLQVKKR